MKFLLLLWGAFFGSLVAGWAAPAARPNLIVVLIDDLSWGDFSCFGNTAVKTPNVDRLAREGMRFEQFYAAAPICSPSRAGFSTGQYPQRWRVTSSLDTRAANAARGMDNWLDPRAPMLARSLREAGYATGHFGKWHLGGQRDVGDAPLITAYGFDVSLTNFEGLGPRVLPLMDGRGGRGGRTSAQGSEELGRGEITWKPRAEVTAAFVTAAVGFIRKSAEAGQPFFVNVWPDGARSPFFSRGDRRGGGQRRPLYHAALEQMDAQLGVLFDEVRGQPKLRNNTLILVCSDNGPEVGAGSAGIFRGGKGMLYEGGLRSPLIVWGPGLVAPARVGTVNRESVLAAIDLGPTLLAVAGVPLPAAAAFDGVDLREVLLGGTKAARGSPLFFRRPPDRGSWAGAENLPDLAVRDGRWKLLCEYDGSRPELYDLNADPRESTNLALLRGAEVRRLTAAVVAWHQAMPPDNGATYATAAAAGAERRPR